MTPASYCLMVVNPLKCLTRSSSTLHPDSDNRKICMHSTLGNWVFSKTSKQEVYVGRLINRGYRELTKKSQKNLNKAVVLTLLIRLQIFMIWRLYCIFELNERGELCLEHVNNGVWSAERITSIHK